MELSDEMSRLLGMSIIILAIVAAALTDLFTK